MAVTACVCNFIEYLIFIIYNILLLKIYSDAPLTADHLLDVLKTVNDWKGFFNYMCAGADLGGGGGCGVATPQNIRTVLPARARMRVCTYVRRYRSGRRHTHAELLIEWRMHRLRKYCLSVLLIAVFLTNLPAT